MLLKRKKIIFCLALLLAPVLALAQNVDPLFNPGKILDDKVFTDTQTFGGSEGVQKFLSNKGSILANTDATFLIKLKEPQSSALKQALDDPRPNLGRLRTAAELIWDASIQSGLNPQVIIVTLEKEQGLISAAQKYSPDKQQLALDHAMGFNCGDNVGCWDLFPGFYYQLFGNFDSGNNRYLGAAKSLMKSLSQGRGPGKSKTGDTIVLDNTLGGFDGILPSQTVQLNNSATAALYRYTPHVFNGNYNFWRFFQNWFKYPNGTLLKLAGATEVYIIQNGLKALLPQFVAVARGLDLNSTITISPTEFQSYDTDKPLGPADNTVVNVEGENKKYLFLSSVKHPVSDLVLKQRGLALAKILKITGSEAGLFEASTVLPPNDGTIIRGVMQKAVYLVVNGKIKMFSAFTFAQSKVKSKQIVTVPDEEIASYSPDGFVAPLDGSLIKSPDEKTVYLVENGFKEPILGDIFKNRGLSVKSIAQLSLDEVKALPTGSYATPKDRTFFSVGSKTGQLYMFKQGTIHSLSEFVAKQRRISPDYVFSSEAVNGWGLGIPVPPVDGTVVKGDLKDDVYLTVKGQLRLLSYRAFLNRKISQKHIAQLPQNEVDSYAKGDAIE